jgi:hypothetical protein
LPAGTRSTTSFTSSIYYAYILDSKGAVTARVREQFSETLIGADQWAIKISNNKDFGPNYTSNWDYNCGVNVSGSDPTCNTWSGNSGAAGAATGTINNGTAYGTSYIYKNYGMKIGKKFPMLNDRIRWTTGQTNIDTNGRWGWHVRGWDVCDPSLCTTTGNGH